MDNINDRVLKIFTTFIMNINQGIENLVIKDYKIGSGIFLLNFIDSNKNCNMRNIADFLDVIPSTATRKMDKLVRFGLVKRVLNEEDRRNVFLILTKEGKEVSNEFFNMKSVNMQKIFGLLTEEEKVIYLGILEKMLSIKDEFTF